MLGRRWSGREELAVAAIRRELAAHPLSVRDQGDLRAELLDCLAQSAVRAAAVAATVLVVFGEYVADTGHAPEVFRARLAEGEPLEIPAILSRAMDRGEIEAGTLKPVVATLVTTLFRHHVMMTLQAPAPELCRQWVDDIFLPLVRKSAA